eukprot:6003596-Alexandrium_andersonii.AAC.1
MLVAGARRVAELLQLSPECILTHRAGRALLLQQNENSVSLPWIARLDQASQSWVLTEEGIQLVREANTR